MASALAVRCLFPGSLLLLLSALLPAGAQARAQKLDTAVLVETGGQVRAEFEAVMEQFLKAMPKNTDFHIVYRAGMEQEGRLFEWAQKTKERPEYAHKKYTFDGLPVEITSSREAYSYLLSNITWYQTIPGEMILIFHTDSIACSKPARQIKDYLQYDYAGPPWPREWGIGTRGGGNGGFTLRRKSKMIERIRKWVATAPGERARHPEDVFFADIPYFKYPPRAEEEAWGVEHIFNPAPLGLHQPWLVQPKLNRDQLRTLRSNCPEVALFDHMLPPHVASMVRNGLQNPPQATQHPVPLRNMQNNYHASQLVAKQQYTRRVERDRRRRERRRAVERIGPEVQVMENQLRRDLARIQRAPPARYRGRHTGSGMRIQTAEEVESRRIMDERRARLRGISG